MSSSDEEIYGTLSNFEIEKKIGRGQFSVVYRAKCVANDQIVALKKVQVNELNFQM
jgi:NIMA (never in mitosis gene a)-related kinase